MYLSLLGTYSVCEKLGVTGKYYLYNLYHLCEKLGSILTLNLVALIWSDSSTLSLQYSLPFTCSTTKGFWDGSSSALAWDFNVASKP